MTLNELIDKTTKTGKLVKFSKGHGKNGLVIVISSEEDEKKYVLDKSIIDYSRFEDWPTKQARTDIKQTGKYYKTEEYGKIPTVQIRVHVEDEDQDIDVKNKEMIF